MVGSGMKQAGEVSNSADQLVQSLVWTDRQTGQLSERRAGHFQRFRKLKNPFRGILFINLSIKANVLKSGLLMNKGLTWKTRLEASLKQLSRFGLAGVQQEGRSLPNVCLVAPAW